MKCVLPAIQAVADKGYLDEKAIGIQGHSWGGYQIAYLDHADRPLRRRERRGTRRQHDERLRRHPLGDGVAAAVPVRENSKPHRRDTCGKRPFKYIENSPVFHADRVHTPLMMLHNDQDDAVPWYQGIEYYLALRRLGKEVYLFNYNGELHGLRKKINQQDYTLRMQQFFDCKLKGASMPAWMDKGIPYSERDKEKEQWKKLFSPEKPRPAVSKAAAGG